MKIAIDCADLDEERIDGTRVYIKNVLDHFGELGRHDRFLLYHRKEFNPLLRPKQFPNYAERKIPYKFVWTQTRLAYELLQDKPDALWMPIQQVPLLVSKKIKTVVTIHDLAFKIFPESFDAKRRWKLNFFHDAAVRRAEKLIAISESTKKDLLKFHPKLDERKISVIHHGFDQKSFSKNFEAAEMAKIKGKLGINGKYLLYVGAIQPRKNLVRLIEAFEIFKKKNQKNEWNGLKLVFAGEKSWKPENTFKKAEKSPFSKDIIFLGKVDFQELAYLYQKAEIFVFPSLYEGFGIPILEAMASGCPVVAANNSSLPEAAGDAAEFFQAEDSRELFEKISKVLFNEDRRRELTEKGHVQVKKFGWEKCARETLEVLKS